MKNYKTIYRMGEKMKNIFILHSLNGDTLKMWGKDVKEIFT